jgi:hypothetical protein
MRNNPTGYYTWSQAPTADSPKLVISYEFDGDSYHTRIYWVGLDKREEALLDRTGPMSRGELVERAFRAIKDHSEGRVVYVSANGGEPIQISSQTTREIRAGGLHFTDLIIGS